MLQNNKKKVKTWTWKSSRSKSISTYIWWWVTSSKQLILQIYVYITFDYVLFHCRISIGNDASSPVSSSHHKNANLEQRLSTKKRELQDTQEKCQKLEHMQDSASKKLQEMGDSLKTKTSSLKSASAENTALESQLAISASEIAVSKNKWRILRKTILVEYTTFQLEETAEDECQSEDQHEYPEDCTGRKYCSEECISREYGIGKPAAYLCIWHCWRFSPLESRYWLITLNNILPPTT